MYINENITKTENGSIINTENKREVNVSPAEVIMVGNTHGHTDFSIKDGAQSVESYVAEIARRGGTKLAITDHGTLMEIMSALSAGKKYNVDIVPAIEWYKKDATDAIRYHLCAYAMDEKGWQAISLITSEANKNLDKTKGKLQFPCVTKDLLTKYIGANTEGYGHVILSSACMEGVLCGIPLASKKAEDAYAVIAKSLNESDDCAKRIANKQAKINEYINNVSLNEAKLKELKEARKTLSKQLTVAKKNKDDKMVADIIDAIGQKDKEIEKYQNLLTGEEAKNNKATFGKTGSLSKEITALKKRLLSDAVYNQKSNEADTYKAQILSGNEIYSRMKEEAEWYNNLVGHGNFYIELQYHGIPEEATNMPIAAKVAKDLNIPVVASNDEHFTRADGYEARRYINAMRFKTFDYHKSANSNDADKQLYVKGDGELSEWLEKILDPATVKEAIDNKGNLLNRCHVEISHEHHYPRFDSNFSKEDSEKLLEDLARKGIASRYPNWDDKLEERLNYELSIINSMGYTDYFLIVQDFLNIGRKLGHVPPSRLAYLKDNAKEMAMGEFIKYIEENQSAPGLTIGPGRGSGAGSIVCYLTGITNIDPIKYDLIFERFLNPERVSMPDIDSDFSNAIRDIVIEYTKKKYGYDGVCGIRTGGTLAAKASIKNVAKVYGSKIYGDSKTYLKLADRISAIIPNTPGAKLADSEEKIRITFANSPDKEAVEEILRISKQIEGSIIQVGAHAAGVVISDNGDIKQHVPIMWDDDNEKWKTQWDKDEVEKHGLLKMDFLGLVNLDIITDTLRMAEKAGYKLPNVERIAYEWEPEVIKTFADADTNSVFQFESSGMKSMLKQFGPSSFEDLILLIAAYRPGPMQFLPDIIKVKHGKKSPEYLTPKLKPILESTYGAIVYQEQVQRIFRELAGYSLGAADLVRRAMGHKEPEKLAIEKEAFINGDPSRNIVGCVANGISADVAAKLFSQMEEFAKYAFNKSHATCYATVSYITAYLKHYFKPQYMAVVMSYVKEEKLPALVNECREAHIKVCVPDINKSDTGLSIHNDCIYFGLKSIKGIGAYSETIVKERETNGEYISVTDFILRANPGKKLYNLIEAGVFDSFFSDDGTTHRQALAAKAELYLAAVKTKLTAFTTKEKLQKILDALNVNDTVLATQLNGGKLPKTANVIKRIETQNANIISATEDLQAIRIPKEIKDDQLEILEQEKDTLGVYVSAHPLDVFEQVSTIEDLETPATNVKLLATISGMAIYTSKRTGKQFSFFHLESKIGSMEGCCFNEDTLRELDNGKSYILEGKIQEDQDGDDVKFFVNSVQSPTKKAKRIIIDVYDEFDWQDKICPIVEKHRSDNGEYTVWWRAKLFPVLRETTLRVDDSIFEDFPNAK